MNNLAPNRDGIAETFSNLTTNTTETSQRSAPSVPIIMVPYAESETTDSSKDDVQSIATQDIPQQPWDLKNATATEHLVRAQINVKRAELYELQKKTLPVVMGIIPPSSTTESASILTPSSVDSTQHDSMGINVGPKAPHADLRALPIDRDRVHQWTVQQQVGASATDSRRLSEERLPVAEQQNMQSTYQPSYWPDGTLPGQVYYDHRLTSPISTTSTNPYQQQQVYVGTRRPLMQQSQHDFDRPTFVQPSTSYTGGDVRRMVQPIQHQHYYDAQSALPLERQQFGVVAYHGMPSGGAQQQYDNGHPMMMTTMQPMPLQRSYGSDNHEAMLPTYHQKDQMHSANTGEFSRSQHWYHKGEHAQNMNRLQSYMPTGSVPDGAHDVFVPSSNSNQQDSNDLQQLRHHGSGPTSNAWGSHQQNLRGRRQSFRGANQHDFKRSSQHNPRGSNQQKFLGQKSLPNLRGGKRGNNTRANARGHYHTYAQTRRDMDFEPATMRLMQDLEEAKKLIPQGQVLNATAAEFISRGEITSSEDSSESEWNVQTPKRGQTQKSPRSILKPTSNIIKIQGSESSIRTVRAQASGSSVQTITQADSHKSYSQQDDLKSSATISLLLNRENVHSIDVAVVGHLEGELLSIKRSARKSVSFDVDPPKHYMKGVPVKKNSTDIDFIPSRLVRDRVISSDYEIQHPDTVSYDTINNAVSVPILAVAQLVPILSQRPSKVSLVSYTSSSSSSEDEDPVIIERRQFGSSATSDLDQALVKYQDHHSTHAPDELVLVANAKAMDVEKHQYQGHENQVLIVEHDGTDASLNLNTTVQPVHGVGGEDELLQFTPSAKLKQLVGSDVHHPSLQEALDNNNMPLITATMITRPVQTTCFMKITNLISNVTRQEIVGLLGSHAKLIKDDDEPIHMIVDRMSNKTTVVFAEFVSVVEATAAIERYESACMNGAAGRIGGRHVEMTISNVDELMVALFPTAKDVRWKNGQPTVRLLENNGDTSRHGLLNPEELIMMLKHTRDPSRFVWAKECPQRVYENLITTLRNYPWYCPEIITLDDRDILAEATILITETLIQCLIHEPEDVHVDSRLLIRLMATVLDCPGFTPDQKESFAVMCEMTSEEAGLVPYASHWHVFRTIAPKPGCGVDIILYYLAMMREASDRETKDQFFAEHNKDQAHNVAKALRQRNIWGEIPSTILSGHGNTLADAAHVEWEHIQRRLGFILNNTAVIS